MPKLTSTLLLLVLLLAVTTTVIEGRNIRSHVAKNDSANRRRVLQDKVDVAKEKVDDAKENKDDLPKDKDITATGKDDAPKDEDDAAKADIAKKIDNGKIMVAAKQNKEPSHDAVESSHDASEEFSHDAAQSSHDAVESSHDAAESSHDAAESSHGAKKKVIVDTDSGWDDALSLLYLMKNPEIEIVGVTVTGCGETDLRWGTIIAQTLLEMGNQTQATIAIGTSTPLWEGGDKHVFPQTFKNDMNDMMGLLGSLNPEITIDIDPRPAWQFIAETLDESQEPITILALGGFTNLAKMLTLYPNTDVQNIQEVFAMAGAVYVDGNIASINDAKEEWGQGLVYSTNRHAEWNIFVDPLATKIVFDSEIPLFLVPMDACMYVTLDPSQVATITATDTLAQLAKNILLEKTGGHSESIHPVSIFDPLTTVIMAGGMINYQTHNEYLDVDLVETEIDNQCGKIEVTDAGSRKITVVQGVSATAFAARFTEVLNN